MKKIDFVVVSVIAFVLFVCVSDVASVTTQRVDDAPVCYPDAEFTQIQDAVYANSYIDAFKKPSDTKAAPEGWHRTFDKATTDSSIVLTAELDKTEVKRGDSVNVNGAASGTNVVDIVVLGPRGLRKMPGSFASEDAIADGLFFTSAEVSDDVFEKSIRIPEETDSGDYQLLVLTPGRDGLYALTMREEGELFDALTDYGWRTNVFVGLNQAQVTEIFEEVTFTPGSDDIAEILPFEVGYQTWHVDDDLQDYPDADFTRIQDAVNTSDKGDTIFVYPGTYYENVNLSKQLSLRGIDTGSGKPVVDAGGNGSAITLRADGITLDGFTATNAGGDYLFRHYAGILVTSNNNTITNNTASSNNGPGIYLAYSRNNTISGNNANNNNGHGILLSYSSNNTISGNTASSNNCPGIYLEYSSNNTILDNANSNNFNGILLSYSSKNNITGNTFVNDGLFVYYDSYQNTVKNNTINGKPLIYLEEVSDMKVTDAGQVILVNCTNITVENLDLSNTSVGIELWGTEDSIISNNTVSSKNYYSIYIGYSSNNTISGNNVSNNYIYGIYLYFSSNNTLLGNTANNNNYGISLSYSSNNIISGNNASNNNGGGIYLHSSCNNNIISVNNASNNNGGSGISLSYSSNNIIIGNNISNNDDPMVWRICGGVKLDDSNNNVIKGNIFVNNSLFVLDSYQNTVEDNMVNGKPLVYLEDSSDIEITDAGQVILVNCTNITVENMDLSNTSVGVELWETVDCRILNNNVSNNRYGLYFSDSNNNIITGNMVCNNNGTGIYHHSSCNNTITGNTVCNNNNQGIYIGKSNNNTISGNNASSNYYSGIVLFKSSNNNITGNTVRNHNNQGIHLGKSNNNTISGNNVSNNGWMSLDLDYSSNNKIYLNNFINSYRTVQSYKSTSIWNSTKPITYIYNGNTYTNYLGNYWEDYTDTDANSDGIWDNPYPIDTDKDYHSLVDPFENYVTVPIPEWRKDIEIGDILYARGGSVLRIEGHVGLYIGNNEVVEARVKPFGVVKRPIETWDNIEETTVCLLRVKCPSETRKEAALFAEGQLGKGWRPMWSWFGKHPDEHSEFWYCSELIWAAYYNQGIDIDKDDLPSMTQEESLSNTVSPTDIRYDDDIEQIGGYLIGKEGVRKSLEFIAHSPVDLIVTDPDGFIISKDSVGIPEAVYLEYDFDEDGSPEDFIFIPDRKIGKYLITVIPAPDANLTDTYTLEVSTEYTTMVLAENVSIRDIPTEPYVFEVIIYFDTGPSENPYPSIMGLHNGTIKPAHDITVNKMYTYPCAGTGGHSEWVFFYNSTTGKEIANGTWKGYVNYQYIEFDKEFVLHGGVTYNYTVKTGSYPQIIHEPIFTTSDGEITCTKFTDANGRVYYEWIPAIKLE